MNRIRIWAHRHLGSKPVFVVCTSTPGVSARVRQSLEGDGRFRVAPVSDVTYSFAERSMALDLPVDLTGYAELLVRHYYDTPRSTAAVFLSAHLSHHLPFFRKIFGPVQTRYVQGDPGEDTMEYEHRGWFADSGEEDGVRPFNSMNGPIDDPDVLGALMTGGASRSVKDGVVAHLEGKRAGFERSASDLNCPFKDCDAAAVAPGFLQ